MPAQSAPSQPDALASAHTALPAEVERAPRKQPDVLRAAVPTKNTQTTAADDEAFAEASNIPSTAPTERVPAPFVHGDFPGGAPLPANKARVTNALPHPEANTTVHVDIRGDAEVLSASAGSAVAASDVRSGNVIPSPVPKQVSILHGSGGPVASTGKSKLVPDVLNGASTDTNSGSVAATSVLAPGVRPADTGRTVDAGYDVNLGPGPLVKVDLYDSAGKLILLPPMKGSHEILVHQNQMAIADGLDRVQDDGQLADMRRLKLLVALPDTDAIYPNDRLPLNRRSARPWVVRFLNDLAQAHYARFHTPLIVTSAVRTVAFQRHLVLINGNAAPPTGDVASPHLYGQAVDIAKRGMSVTELAWMRSYLTPNETAGKIDVEEEFQQACFHLSVYRRYLGLPAPRDTRPLEVAPARMLQQVKAVQPSPVLHPLQRAKAALTRRRRLPTALLAAGLR